MAIDYTFKSYVLREHTDLLNKAKKCGLVDYSREQLTINGVISPFWLIIAIYQVLKNYMTMQSKMTCLKSCENVAKSITLHT